MAEPSKYDGWKETHGNKKYRQRDWLECKYHKEGLSTYDIGDICDVDSSTIYSWLKRHGIETRSISEARTGTHPNFFVDGKGYRRAQAYSKDKDRPEQVKIHRLAAVAWFGFDKVAGNDIHHKNDHPLDNRESNLKPIEHGEHTRLHNNQRYGNS